MNPRGHRIWRLVRPVVLLGVSFLVARVIIVIVGSIDWAAVRDALGRLSVGSAMLLLVVLAARQVLNAIPLTQFVSGLSLSRSMQNDVTAFLIGTVAPPPSDVVLRVSMFKSWGIDPVQGMAGVTLNTLTFYAVRFFAPVLGIMILAFYEVDRGQILRAAGSALVALGILAALVSISHGDRLAALIGYSAGRVASRFRASVNPDAWADAVTEFRGQIGDRVSTGIAPSMAALVAMVLSEATMVAIALRSVGVDAQAVPLAVVYGAILLAYPLTLFPLMGLGILDAALVAGWTATAGIAYEPQIVAGLIVWRVVSLLIPFPLGVGALLWWRRGATHLQRSGSGVVP